MPFSTGSDCLDQGGACYGHMYWYVVGIVAITLLINSDIPVSSPFFNAFAFYNIDTII
ncbi:hypothetical protein [Bartonella senegalensis]|uniref:hypothetical protein n=1 Tax=Bartonella senegalensis TaxID=1468418 RepID=UPI0012B5A01A|nr:hypothetical protein [Bartonella senegalensis]